MINFTPNNLPTVGQVRKLLNDVASPTYNLSRTLNVRSREKFKSVQEKLIADKAPLCGKGKGSYTCAKVDVSKYAGKMNLEADATSTTLKVVPIGLIALARSFSRDKKMITDAHIKQFCDALRTKVEARYSSQYTPASSSNTPFSSSVSSLIPSSSLGSIMSSSPSVSSLLPSSSNVAETSGAIVKGASIDYKQKLEELYEHIRSMDDIYFGEAGPEHYIRMIQTPMSGAETPQEIFSSAYYYIMSFGGLLYMMDEIEKRINRCPQKAHIKNFKNINEIVKKHSWDDVQAINKKGGSQMEVALFLRESMLRLVEKLKPCLTCHTTGETLKEPRLGGDNYLHEEIIFPEGIRSQFLEVPQMKEIIQLVAAFEKLASKRFDIA